MAKFGSKLVEQQYSPWAEYYLDYTLLKDLLGNEDSRTYYSDASLTMNSVLFQESASASFLTSLNKEVEKILLFFIYQQGLIADQMKQCRAKLVEIHSANRGGPRLAGLAQEYRNLAHQLLRLVQYVDLNLTGLRKILKKHDKIYNKHLAKNYFGRRGTILGPLFQIETIDALIYLLERSYRDVYKTNVPPPPSMVQVAPPKEDSGYMSPIGTKSARVMYRKQFSARLDTGETFDESIENYIYQIHKSREELQKSSEFVQYLAASLLVAEPAETEKDEDEERYDEGEDLRPISNVLNLLSTFLYMTNYYIVAPTCGAYADKLGAGAALGSLIIGMTPMAALVSTLLYSWWTSHSYKAALIFASTCSLLGNLLYALGLPLNSITLVMIGRLLNGFGSARSINRRYIADSFARKERTAASAWFVTAGALGMAAGPAFSSILHYADVAGLDSPYWQDENSPGWLMFILWSVFLACLILYFRNPPKTVEVTEKPKVEDQNGEMQPLMIAQESAESIESTPTFLSYVPILTTFTIYFVLKLVLECLMSSTSSITGYYFLWSGKVIGFYMAALGLLMLPANLVVARFSQNYSDRELIFGLQIIMALGCVAIMHFGSQYTVLQYIAGSTILFLSTNALEGPNMSLLSKTIPRSWSKGIVNVGLLATEAGTLGRVVGDVYLTVCGAHGGFDSLLNVTFGTMALLSFISLFITFQTYGLLDPSDKDD